jgi:hypothetical protein
MPPSTDGSPSIETGGKIPGMAPDARSTFGSVASVKSALVNSRSVPLDQRVAVILSATGDDRTRGNDTVS